MGAFSGSIGSIWLEVGARISNLESGLAQASKAIDTTFSEAEQKWAGFEKLGGRMTNWGAGLSTAVTAPILALGAVAVKASGDFDTAMRTVSARGDITGQDLQKLKAQAEALGAATQFSSKQAAEGMAEFAGAGFKTQQIYDAMPGTLNLAAAAQTSVGEAAKTVKDLLGQFNLTAADTSRVADVLAKAGNEGSGSIAEMANSLRYAGPVARAAGMDIEQTNAALLVLDKAGIRGEMAGTSLRAMLASLSGPSKEAAGYINELGIKVTDANGKMLPFSNVIEQFRGALAKIPNEAEKSNALVQVFGREALAAANILTSAGSPALLDYETKLRNAGGEAKRTADVLNSGMSGALEKMTGSIETAAQKIGDNLAPTIMKLAGFIETAGNAIAEFAGWFGKLPEPVQASALAIVALVAAVGPLLLIGGQLVTSITSLAAILPGAAAGVSLTTGAVVASTAAFAAYTVGVIAAAAAIGTVIVAYNNWKQAEAEATKAHDDQVNGLLRLERHLTANGANISELKRQYDQGQISFARYHQELAKVAKGIGDAKKVTGEHNKVQTEAEKTTDAVAKAMAKASKEAGNHAKQIKAADESTKPFIQRNELLDEVFRKIEASQKAVIARGAEASIWLSEHGRKTVELTGDSEELTEAINDMVGAVNLTGPAFDRAGKAAGSALGQAMQPARDLEKAYRDLGITSVKSLEDHAAQATKNYETIKNSGIASARDIDIAWIKMEESRIAAAKAAGVEIPKETQATLDNVKAKIEGHTTATKGTWDTWQKQVSTIVTDLGKNITDVLWDGDKSWGEKGKSVLKSLGDASTRSFVEPTTAAIHDLVNGAIADLIGGKGFGGVLDRVKDLGSAVTGVFGGGGSTAGSVGGAASGGAGNIGGAGAGVGSAAGAGMTAVVGAVAGVASAISGIIGNFQNAKMEGTLNGIEHNTRYSMMYLGERGDGGILGQLFRIQENTQYLNPLLDGLNQKLDQWLQPLGEHLTAINSRLSFAQVRFDEISSNTHWGLLSSQENGGVLQSMLTELRTIASKSTVVQVTVAPQTGGAAGSARMQGVVAL